MKMINVGPMRIPADQLPTLVKLLSATITTKIPEIRCCTSGEGCGDIDNCPYDLEELYSHLTPGESQTAMCDKIGSLVSIHHAGYDCKGYKDSPICKEQSYE